MEVPNAPTYATGWLKKRGGSFKKWKRRWFVLNGNILWYFAKQSHRRPRGYYFIDATTTAQLITPDIMELRASREVQLRGENLDTWIEVFDKRAENAAIPTKEFTQFEQFMLQYTGPHIGKYKSVKRAITAAIFDYFSPFPGVVSAFYEYRDTRHIERAALTGLCGVTGGMLIGYVAGAALVWTGVTSPIALLVVAPTGKIIGAKLGKKFARELTPLPAELRYHEDRRKQISAERLVQI